MDDPRVDAILKRLDKLEASNVPARILDVEREQITLRNEFEVLNQNMADVKTILTEIRSGLIGDTTDPSKPGILIRLDRIEQKDQFKGKIIWFLLGTIVALIPFLWGVAR